MTLSCVGLLSALSCGAERPPVEQEGVQDPTEPGVSSTAPTQEPLAGSSEAQTPPASTALEQGPNVPAPTVSDVSSSMGETMDSSQLTGGPVPGGATSTPWDSGSTAEGGTVTDSEAATAAPSSSGAPKEEFITAVPIARGEHGVGTLAGEVYILGGFTPAVTSSVQAYSPATDQWRDVADFPVVLHHPNVATVEDKLYVLGFHAGSGQRKADASSYVYDRGVDQWQPITPMPPETARGASCVTTYAGKVYVFGGTNDVALPDASVYDPASDEWESLPFLPATRHHCVAAAIGDKIYIVSGRDVIIEEVQAESYVFDPETRLYTEVAPILTPRGGAAGALLEGKIYVFGGEGNVNDPRKIFHETEVYDPLTDTWTGLPDMSVPRHGFGAAVIGDRIYLPAGSVSQGIDVVDTHTVFYLE